MLRICGAGVAIVLLVSCAGGGAAPRDALAYERATPNLTEQIRATFPKDDTVTAALLPLDGEGDVAREVGQLLLDELAVSLAAAPGIRLIERQKLKAVLRELAIQETFGLSPDSQSALGNSLGARYLISTRASKIGESVKLISRVVDTQSGETTGGAQLAVLYDTQLKEAVADRNARMNIRTSREVRAALDRIHRGELEAAQEYFAELGKGQEERRSVGLMGMAAVAYARAQAKPAREMCESSRALSDAPSYCWVIEGKLSFEQGALDAAKAFFTQALNDETTLTGWQRSEAANGLGLIAATENDPGNAGQLYARAVELDPTHAEALSNQAKILEDV
ncbi:MAG: hypothetical protein AAFY60_08130, partial [Myxococcota bacterium]